MNLVSKKLIPYSDKESFFHINFGAGGGCDVAIRTLAAAWKKLMVHSDSELNIDSEYSRPGTVALLNQFKEKVSEIPDQCHYKFNWNVPAAGKRKLNELSK